METSDTPEKPADTGAAAAAPDAAAAPAESAEAPEDAAAGDDLAGQLKAAQQEAAEQKDQYLRAVAELENVKRRAEKRIAEAHQYALSDFALAVGEVRDCLEAALDSASAAQYDKLHEGVSLTLRKLTSAMDARHILPIRPDIGVSFDPTVHMAMGQMPASEQAAAETVAAVVQAGYMLNGRVIRAAGVMVAADLPPPAAKAQKSGKPAKADKKQKR